MMVAVLALSSGLTSGCAAVFRSSAPPVQFESDPDGAQIFLKEVPQGQPTPAVIQVPRAGTTYVAVTKPGYADHRSVVKKSKNGAWLTWDILTCAIPVLLCIPLIADGASGAWNNVERVHHAKLEPLGPGGPNYGARLPPGMPVGAGASPSASSNTAPPRPEMSESERKATARAAFLEGVELADKGDCTHAIGRFEIAQRLFDAPTHLQHLADCQVSVGKLIEAQENYETLAHANLSPQAPDAFKQAQESGRQSLAALRQRIPTMRIQINPSPSTLRNLVVQINGKVMPTDLIGIARPVNPGTYRVVTQATGYKTTQREIVLVEGDTKTLEVQLTR
ncbi:hypothetical protein AKJ09_04816 [Labilithrix luteola]|uniref:PEGA domain-containing protein n=1 Tax=Labilithrix luteola TaxID=1391654 RepID=A0A0K1PXA7_9BACT|nr:hypothetical protein AKJ09_04816 [Labilithrix luteola]